MGGGEVGLVWAWEGWAAAPGAVDVVQATAAGHAGDLRCERRAPEPGGLAQPGQQARRRPDVGDPDQYDSRLHAGRVEHRLDLVDHLQVAVLEGGTPGECGDVVGADADDHDVVGTRAEHIGELGQLVVEDLVHLVSRAAEHADDDRAVGETGGDPPRHRLGEVAGADPGAGGEIGRAHV